MLNPLRMSEKPDPYPNSGFKLSSLLAKRLNMILTYKSNQSH